MTLATPIREVLDAHEGDLNNMEKALIEREDAIADMLRMAATNFGMFPQIVAEVIAEIGIGTKPTPEERMIIRQQFLALMQHVRDQMGEN